MKLAITGAGGYLGTELVRQALTNPLVTSLRVTDRALPPLPADVEVLKGDLRNAALRDQFLDGVDSIVHLAAMLGKAAENDPEAARQINIDVPLAMIETLRGTQTRIVFASSVAVLGADLPQPVTDATPCAPTLLYGAHKAMIETALSCETRNGRLDAVSLRPSGIVARDGLDAALKTAFMSQVFWAVRRGEDIVLPVEPDGQTWMASAKIVAKNFLHAATTGNVPLIDAVTLPALVPSFAELVEGLKRRFPESPSKVDFEPDEDIVDLFGSMPNLKTERASRAGFVSDPDLDTLIINALHE